MYVRPLVALAAADPGLTVLRLVSRLAVPGLVPVLARPVYSKHGRPFRTVPGNQAVVGTACLLTCKARHSSAPRVLRDRTCASPVRFSSSAHRPSPSACAPRRVSQRNYPKAARVSRDSWTSSCSGDHSASAGWGVRSVSLAKLLLFELLLARHGGAGVASFKPLLLGDLAPPLTLDRVHTEARMSCIRRAAAGQGSGRRRF